MMSFIIHNHQLGNSINIGSYSSFWIWNDTKLVMTYLFSNLASFKIS
jgi:hypothetical protein